MVYSWEALQFCRRGFFCLNNEHDKSGACFLSDNEYDEVFKKVKKIVAQNHVKNAEKKCKFEI
jgi:hypothetical protein